MVMAKRVIPVPSMETNWPRAMPVKPNIPAGARSERLKTNPPIGGRTSHGHSARVVQALVPALRPRLGQQPICIALQPSAEREQQGGGLTQHIGGEQAGADLARPGRPAHLGDLVLQEVHPGSGDDPEIVVGSHRSFPSLCEHLIDSYLLDYYRTR